MFLNELMPCQSINNYIKKLQCLLNLMVMINNRIIHLHVDAFII